MPNKTAIQNCKYLSFVSGVSVKSQMVNGKKYYIFINSNGNDLIACFGYGSAKNIAKAIKIGKMLSEQKGLTNA